MQVGPIAERRLGSARLCLTQHLFSLRSSHSSRICSNFSNDAGPVSISTFCFSLLLEMTRLTTQYLYRILGGCFIVLLAFSIFSEWENSQPRPLSGDEIFPLLEDSTVRTSAHSDVDIVVASQQRDDTKWLEIDFPAWNRHIYVTDDPQASRRVPTNKGREAMVYLT